MIAASTFCDDGSCRPRTSSCRSPSPPHSFDIPSLCLPVDNAPSAGGGEGALGSSCSSACVSVSKPTGTACGAMLIILMPVAPGWEGGVGREGPGLSLSEVLYGTGPVFCIKMGKRHSPRESILIT